MHHARSTSRPSGLACGSWPLPDKIPIVAETLGDVTCCDCIRATGFRPMDLHPGRYERDHRWINDRRRSAA
jgi:hypothetical protein